MLRSTEPVIVEIEPTFGSVSSDLAVPTVLQVRKFWCWAACIAMLEHLNGRSARVCEVVSPLIGTSCCDDAFDEQTCDRPVRQSLISSYWTSAGYSAEIFDRPLEIGEVRSAIASNHAIQAAQFFFTGSGHVVLLTGWETDDNGVEWILVDDPYRGESLVEYQDFKSGYSGAIWLWSWRVNCEREQ